MRIDALVYTMGEKADKILKTFAYSTSEDKTKYDTIPVLAKFSEYFVPRRNIIYERSIFHSRKQAEHESIEKYYSDLYELILNCDYPDSIRDDLLRDCFVLGLCDGDMQRKLYMKHDLDIKKTVDMAGQNELIKLQMITQTPGVAVHEVTKSRGRQPPRGRGRGVDRRSRGGERGGFRGRGDNRQVQHDARNVHRDGSCDNCRYPRHKEGEKCPAWGKACSLCSKRNHFRRKCRSKTVHEAVVYPEVDSGGPYFLGAVDCIDNTKAWFVTLPVCGGNVKFKIDTGADISTISPGMYSMLPNTPVLTPAVGRIISLGGDISCNGTFTASSEYKNTLYRYQVAVVPSDHCLLGREVATQMGLVRRVDSNAMKTEEVAIQLCDDAEPCCLKTARKVAFPRMQPVKEELERMVKDGIITPVTQPTEWCAGMVPAVKRNGKIRICVDLKRLNCAVRWELYPLQTLDDIKPKLGGAQVFSKLDAASGFWQVPLEASSQKYTTFITPFGRFMFRRMPFGISSATEIFQRKMVDLLKDLEGVDVIVDDVLMYGATRQEHDERLNKVLQRIKEAGLKLNEGKCEFARSELEYFGHIISKDGVKPTQERVRALREMDPPEDVTELRRKIRMFNFLGKYLPHLSTVMGPMTALLKADTAWYWGMDQQKAFDSVKKMLAEAPVLAYYDQTRHTIVSADASSYGVGAVLLQDHDYTLKPVAFASRTLSAQERRYAQVEKECLACVWACEKFSRYLVGLPTFELHTDHKPLVPLLTTKNLADAPVRCQRMLMRMLRFNPTVSHVPGKQLVVADTLSRKPLRSSVMDSDELEQDVDLHVEAVIMGWPVSTDRLETIRQMTDEDEELRAVAEYVALGWPDSPRKLPGRLLPYHAERAELSLLDGVVTHGDRIVMPKALRGETLERLHESHQGLERTRERARCAVWWPGITMDIKAVSDCCAECRERRPSQNHEPLKPSEPAARPWEKVAVDLLTFRGHDYLVLVDAYSKWLEIKHLKSTTAQSVVNRLTDIFIIHGFPNELHSDNGGQFPARKMMDFTDRCDIKQTTSSPYFHQGNGLAERGVQTAKRILALKNPELGLLDYRATPCTVTKVSPAEALMSRRLRTRVPQLESTLMPQVTGTHTISERDRVAKARHKRYYDQRHGVKPLRTLHSGQRVLLKDDEEKGWVRAGYIKRQLHDRSYLVQGDQGLYRRNRKHLLPAATSFTPAAQPAVPPPVPDSTPLLVGMENMTSPPGDSGVVTVPSSAPGSPAPARERRATKLPYHLKDYVLS